MANLTTFLKSIPPYWKPLLDMFYAMIGHPEKDAERLRATSPVFHADRIKAPLLIAQGARDPRVVKPKCSMRWSTRCANAASRSSTS